MLLLVGTVCLTSCGCDYINTSLDTLITPPSMNEQQAEILKALDASLQKDETITLEYPENGNYRSAVIIYDIDEEPTDEAIVFYNSSVESTLGETGLRICLLDQFEDGWRAIWNLPGPGEDVDKVLFFTDHQTGEKFVIIGFSTEKQMQKSYMIYRYRDGVFEQVYTAPYQMLEVFDITNDGLDDIITIAYKEEPKNKNTVQTDSPQQTNAYVVNYQNGVFALIDQTQMAGKAVNYNNVVKDTTSFGKPALFLDEQISKNTYATEILTCENGRLKNSIVHDDVDLFEQTLRTQVPISYDFNKDSITEIPCTEFFPGYSEISENPLYLTKWYQLHDNALVQTGISYVNYSQGFGFLLPDDWEGRVSAKQTVQDDEVTFFLFDGSIEDDSQKILSIRTDTLNHIRTNGVPDGYFEIMTIGQVVYLAKQHVDKTDPFYLSDREVQDRFVEMHVSLQQ